MLKSKVLRSQNYYKNWFKINVKDKLTKVNFHENNLNLKCCVNVFTCKSDLLILSVFRNSYLSYIMVQKILSSISLIEQELFQKAVELLSSFVISFPFHLFYSFSFIEKVSHYRPCLGSIVMILVFSPPQIHVSHSVDIDQTRYYHHDK
jgi:hypothetical protein